MSNYDIPFDRKGNMMHYPERGEVIVWRPNYKFHETLKIIGMERGRSAAHFLIEKSGGETYYIFMKDLVDLIQNHLINKGYVTAHWTFCKRGQNYGIRAI